MDGTLVSSELDFGRIRAEAGVPEGIGILEHMARSPAGERWRVSEVLAAHERRAARQCSLLPGAVQLLAALRDRGLKTALLTRNSRPSMRLVLERFGLAFDCTVAREDAPPKPSPEPLLKIAEALALETAELLMVGDYVFDVECGRNAGTCTALVRTGKALALVAPADIMVDNLLDLLHYLPPARTNR